MLVQVRNPWSLSFIFHVFFIIIIILITKFDSSDIQITNIPLIEVEVPKEVQNIKKMDDRPKVAIKSVNQPEQTKTPQREIFGISRESYTDENVGREGVEAKRGNTLAKELDETTLSESDATTLPTPTEEYLVSEMPSVLNEVRPVYPREAREYQLEGVVVMDVLIDDRGVVRQVEVVDGENVFRPGAIEAMKKFTFKPAKIEGRPVAVRIRYSLKFLLEY